MMRPPTSPQRRRGGQEEGNTAPAVAVARALKYRNNIKASAKNVSLFTQKKMADLVVEFIQMRAPVTVNTPSTSLCLATVPCPHSIMWSTICTRELVKWDYLTSTFDDYR